MSIRLRLTLLYSAILAITLIVGSIVLYEIVSHVALGLAQDALTAEARSVALTFQPPHQDHDHGGPPNGQGPYNFPTPHAGGTAYPPPGSGQAGSSSSGAPAQSSAYQNPPGTGLPSPGPGQGQGGNGGNAMPYPCPTTGSAQFVFNPPPGFTPQDSIQISCPNGTVVYRSPDLIAEKATLPLHPPATQQVQPSTGPPIVITVGGKQMLLATMPLDGAQGGILQVARSLQDVDQTLTILRQVLILGSGIVTLLAFGAGWVLAGTALRPINRIAQTAQEIGAAQDFERRVDYVGPQDEVGRLASTFNTMLAGLQAAYQAQRRFVGDASHELRTPLTTIRGNLGLLQRRPPIAESDRVAVLDDIVSETDRLSRLVSDLLTLARSDAQRSFRRETIPIGPLLADVVRRFAVLHGDRLVQREVQPDAVAVADPDALTQVLLILFDNALKFTPDDGVVTVTTTVDADHVSIAVRDTGAGIAPDVLPHIFERFYQGDEARTGTGTGLGLSIAQALVAGQHGTIHVESTVGQGSTFTIVLPRATGTSWTVDS